MMNKNRTYVCVEEVLSIIERNKAYMSDVGYIHAKNAVREATVVDAVEALEKQTPKKVACDGDDESDYVYCPCCHGFIGSNDFVYDDFYHRNWKPMYCIECGQAMIWK